MKYVNAGIGGALVALVVYLVVWFVARNMIDGLGALIEIGGHVLVVFVAVVAGYSSYRASLNR
jgi:hypothetical protein